MVYNFQNGGSTTVYVGNIVYKGTTYTNLASLTVSEIGNIIIYYSGTYNEYPYTYLQAGYYKYIATSTGSGNSILNNTSAWEYIGTDIPLKADNVQFGDGGKNGAYVNSFSYNGNTYTSLASLTVSEVGNIIVYYPGTYNQYPYIYTKAGYYKYIATSTSSVNPFLNTTTSWEYIGDSINE